MIKSNQESRTQKIAIVGPESTGKSSLTLALANALEAPYVLEQARGYLENNGLAYTQADVEAIARLQLKAEDDALSPNPNLLVCDTNLIVIKIWMDNAYGSTPAWILEEIKQRSYTIHLLTGIDIPWQADPQREHPHLRAYFLEKYKETLSDFGIKFHLISGNENARLTAALQVLAQEGITENTAKER
jgi:nicotinamide riboside kinase